MTPEDRPTRLNKNRARASRVTWLERGRRLLFVASRMAVVLVIVALFGGMGWGGHFLYQRFDVPIEVIGVDGKLLHIKPAEVEAIVAENLGGGFLSLNLDAIRRGLEQHPWVASASARRQWPNAVEISIEEEVPIARWGDNGFLNNSGEVLAIEEVKGLDTLPLLSGPEGQSRQVMSQYRTFAQLLQATELRITDCVLGERGNWLLKLDQGPQLIVGRGQVTAKFKRFLLVWQSQLKAQLADIAVVDVRYGNGVAVSWKGESSNGIATKENATG
jgi:cell division protein FtsQ